MKRASPVRILGNPASRFGGCPDGSKLSPQLRIKDPKMRDIILWLAGVPIIAIIAMHSLGILR